MMYAYSHPDDVRLKGRQARLDMINKYSIAKFGEILRNEFERIVVKMTKAQVK